MVGLIDADELLWKLSEYKFAISPITEEQKSEMRIPLQMLTEFEHMVSEQPTVDTVPVVHGHWEIVPNDENRDDYYKMRCSVCGGTLWSIQPEELYCCKCGAKMDATDINLDDGSTTEDVSVVQRKDRDDE